MKYVFRDPQNINARFVNFLMDVYHKRLFVKDLVKSIEEISDETSDFKIRWNANPTDVVRLLVAAYDSKVFRAVEGEIISIEMVMEEFGKLFQIDLSNHSRLLSNGLNNTIETNLRIIDKMRQNLTERHKNKN